MFCLHHHHRHHLRHHLACVNPELDVAPNIFRYVFQLFAYNNIYNFLSLCHAFPHDCFCYNTPVYYMGVVIIVLVFEKGLLWLKRQGH